MMIVHDLLIAQPKNLINVGQDSLFNNFLSFNFR